MQKLCIKQGKPKPSHASATVNSVLTVLWKLADPLTPSKCKSPLTCPFGFGAGFSASSSSSLSLGGSSPAVAL